jgi:exodeoxyribonuclease VII small subunit
MAEPDGSGKRAAGRPGRPDGEGVGGEDVGGEGVEGRTFEELMNELEAVTERLATGELGIEAAVDLYERAERLHAQATARLAQVQARVEALTSSGRAEAVNASAGNGPPRS